MFRTTSRDLLAEIPTAARLKKKKKKKNAQVIFDSVSRMQSTLDCVNKKISQWEAVSRCF